MSYSHQNFMDMGSLLGTVLKNKTKLQKGPLCPLFKGPVLGLVLTVTHMGIIFPYSLRSTSK